MMMTIKEACSLPKVLQESNPATRAALVSSGILKRYQKGEHLFLDHTKVEHFYFIITGTAALYKLNHQHDKKVIFIYGNGEMLNEVMIQDEFSSINCELLSDALVLQFPKKQFLGFMAQDYQLAEAVMKSMAVKIRRLYHQLKNTSNSIRLDKQIAAKLWKLSKDHGVPCEEGIEINFDLPITYLADLVGSKRETVSRQVKQLTELNLIIVKKNRFIVKNREKLLEFFREA